MSEGVNEEVTRGILKYRKLERSLRFHTNEIALVSMQIIRFKKVVCVRQ